MHHFDVFLTFRKITGIFGKNGGHLGFGSHFEFCYHKNVYAWNFVLLPCISVCDFVLIRGMYYELELETWFLGQIWSNFYIWPQRVRSILWNFKKRIYMLVYEAKLHVCANFCPNRTYPIRMTSQNVFFW